MVDYGCVLTVLERTGHSCVTFALITLETNSRGSSK